MTRALEFGLRLVTMIVTLPVTFQSRYSPFANVLSVRLSSPAGTGVDEVDPFAPSSSIAVPVRRIESQEMALRTSGSG